MSSKAGSRKEPATTRARDNHGTRGYTDLPTEEVWSDKPDSSKERSFESSPNMVAALPESDPGKTNFNTSDLKSMAISCARSKLRGDLNFFVCMLRRIPTAVHVLELSHEKFSNLTQQGMTYRSIMLDWDAFLARFIMGAIDTSDVDGKAFMAQLKTCPNLMLSGRRIYHLLLEKSQVAVGAEIIAIQARFDAGNYVKHGQKEGEIFLSSISFQEDYDSLPVGKAGHAEMMRLYIEKLPKEFNTLKAELQREFNKAIVMNSGSPWSWPQLQRLVVAESQMAHSSSGFTTMMSDLEINYTKEQLENILCKNCGGKGHTASHCPSVCGACALKCCGGANKRNPKCMTIYGLGQKPLNALGQPLLDRFVAVVKNVR